MGHSPKKRVAALAGVLKICARLNPVGPLQFTTQEFTLHFESYDAGRSDSGERVIDCIAWIAPQLDAAPDYLKL
jgi:hypothetical protein